MKVLKFTLKGKTAFFKKPDVNTYLYFTYGNIHKVALLGIFGAILGYSGYNMMKIREELSKSNKKNKSEHIYPEFYEKLKNVKVSVTPKADKGFIPKKVQSFNNSVGYASKELGGNLIIKEQWLENPAWDIYVLIDNEESKKLSQYILNNEAVYSPYLGKNDHYADILNAEVLDVERINDMDSISKIDCLFKRDDFNLSVFDEEDDDEYDEEDEIEELFKYEEKLPSALNADTSMYELDTFIFTNMSVKAVRDSHVYRVNSKNIVFY